MKKKNYKVNVGCCNCGYSRIIDVPFGTRADFLYEVVKDGEECTNCGCILREKETWWNVLGLNEIHYTIIKYYN